MSASVEKGRGALAILRRNPIIVSARAQYPLCAAGVVFTLMQQHQVNHYIPTVTIQNVRFALDTAILLVFTAELLIKLYAYRLDFFRSGWNLFDLAIVVIAWVPASGPFAVLRALRVLRVLRLLSVVPQMRRVISAIGHSIPGMLSVIGVLSILFYVSAVLTTKLFGQHPDPQLHAWFGSIGSSAYTLFQVMTLESWSMGIVRPVMVHYPWAWIFFVPFIIITSFAVLNLFIGIIVDAMQMVQQENRADEQEFEDTVALQQNTAGPDIQQQLDDIRQSIEKLHTAVAARDP